MTNSLQVSINISAEVDCANFQFDDEYSLMPQNDPVSDTIVLAPTTAQALPLGPVQSGQIGLVYIKNLDAANTVAIGTDSAVAAPFAVLKPGQGIPIPAAPSATYYTKANNAAVELLVAIFST